MKKKINNFFPIVFIIFLSLNAYADRNNPQNPLTKEDKLDAQKDINKRIKFLADLKSCFKEGKSFKELKKCSDSYTKKLEKHNKESDLLKINKLKYF